MMMVVVMLLLLDALLDHQHVTILRDDVECLGADLVLSHFVADESSSRIQ